MAGDLLLIAFLSIIDYICIPLRYQKKDRVSGLFDNNVNKALVMARRNEESEDPL